MAWKSWAMGENLRARAIRCSVGACTLALGTVCGVLSAASCGRETIDLAATHARALPEAGADHQTASTPIPMPSASSSSEPPAHMDRGQPNPRRSDAGPLAPSEPPVPDAGAPLEFTGRCTTDNDCGLFYVCDPTTSRCVECTATKSKCPTGYVCIPDVNRCAIGCKSNTTCSAPFGICDPTRNVCVECLSNQDCMNLSGSTAPGAANFCVTPGLCVECLGEQDCPLPEHCDLNYNVCTECRNTGDCPQGAACVPFAPFLQRCEPMTMN